MRPIDAAGGELAITAGWGHAGKEGVTMPAKGKLAERQYNEAEVKAIDAEAADRAVARRTAGAAGRDEPTTYTSTTRHTGETSRQRVGLYHRRLSGHQEMAELPRARNLGRPLKPEEAREVMNMARRIAAILLLQPKLDENYREAVRTTYDWGRAAVGP